MTARMVEYDDGNGPRRTDSESCQCPDPTCPICRPTPHHFLAQVETKDPDTGHIRTHHVIVGQPAVNDRVLAIGALRSRKWTDAGFMDSRRNRGLGDPSGVVTPCMAPFDYWRTHCHPPELIKLDGKFHNLAYSQLPNVKFNPERFSSPDFAATVDGEPYRVAANRRGNGHAVQPHRKPDINTSPEIVGEGEVTQHPAEPSPTQPFRSVHDEIKDIRAKNDHGRLVQDRPLRTCEECLREFVPMKRNQKYCKTFIPSCYYVASQKRKAEREGRPIPKYIQNPVNRKQNDG
jgi:hypothetical protein